MPLQLNFTMEEESPVGQTITNVVSELRRRGVDASACSASSDLFQLSSSGELQPWKRVDREACPSSARQDASCTIIIPAFCQLNDSSALFLKFAVSLHDINDNAPSWTEARYEAQVAESSGSQLPQPVRVPLARDADIGSNAAVHYTLSGADRSFFRLAPGNDALYLQFRMAVDREQREQLRVTVEARDNGSPSLNSSLDVLIRVVDVNDHAPQFVGTPYRVSVSESVDVRTVIFTLVAVDGDGSNGGINGQVSYRVSELSDAITRRLFNVEEQSGRVSLLQTLDFETSRSHQLRVIAVDGGAVPLSSETTLTVDVTDVNDNAVAITYTPSNHATCSSNSEADLCVSENTRPGSWLATIFAEDRDAGDNERIACHSNTLGFALAPLYPGSTREFNLTVHLSLDRESNDHHVAILVCSDNGQPPLSSTLTLRVNVLDTNDNPPRFVQQVFNISLPENRAPPIGLLRLIATDADSPDNALITYRLHPEDSHVRGLIDVEKSGNVIVVAALDRETSASLRFRVLAVDSGYPAALSATATVLLNIVDLNDVPPVFDQPIYTFQVDEQSDPVCLGSVRAIDGDADASRRGPVTYELPFPTIGSTLYDARDDFEVNTSTGLICCRRSLDRELLAEYNFNVLALDNPRDVAERRLTATASVRVLVSDVNDNSPTFLFPNSANWSVNVSLLTPEHSTIARAVAFDPDKDDNGAITYSLERKTLAQDTESEPIFHIDRNSGEITLLKSFMSLQKADSNGFPYRHMLYKLYIIATDGGNPMRESRHSLDVIVDSSSGKLREEKAPTGIFLTDHPQFILVVLLSLLALVFLVMLIVVISCAFSGKCCSKRPSQRRRPKDTYMNADQERNLIPPTVLDGSSQLAVHCLNSPISRGLIGHSQTLEAQCSPNAKNHATCGMGALRFDSSPSKQQRGMINTSPSFNIIRKNNIDLARYCNTIPHSCPTSPPLEEADDAPITPKRPINQSSCDSEVRAFTPKAFNLSGCSTIEQQSALRTIYQPTTVNLSESNAAAQLRMHTFPKGKSPLVLNDMPRSNMAEITGPRAATSIRDAVDDSVVLAISLNKAGETCICGSHVSRAGHWHRTDCDYYERSSDGAPCTTQHLDSQNSNDSNNNDDDRSSSASQHDSIDLTGVFNSTKRPVGNVPSMTKHLTGGNKATFTSSFTDEISAI